MHRHWKVRHSLQRAKLPQTSLRPCRRYPALSVSHFRLTQRRFPLLPHSHNFAESISSPNASLIPSAHPHSAQTLSLHPQFHPTRHPKRHSIVPFHHPRRDSTKISLRLSDQTNSDTCPSCSKEHCCLMPLLIRFGYNPSECRWSHGDRLHQIRPGMKCHHYKAAPPKWLCIFRPLFQMTAFHAMPSHEGPT